MLLGKINQGRYNGLGTQIVCARTTNKYRILAKKKLVGQRPFGSSIKRQMQVYILGKSAVIVDSERCWVRILSSGYFWY